MLARRGSRKIIICKDTRISEHILEAALELDVGWSSQFVRRLYRTVPTPAIAYLTYTFRTETSVFIYVPHNLFYDNGIRFFHRCHEIFKRYERGYQGGTS